MTISTEKIRLVIVDDQVLFKNGLSMLMQTIPEFELMGTYENGRVFATALADMPVLPHVALVDMNMPDMNGMELTEHLQKHAPGIKVIILTVYDQERFVLKMIEAGVCGYLLKNCETEEVVKAVKAVYHSDYYFNDTFMKALKNRTKIKNTNVKTFSNIPVDLTKRETEILVLICQEYTNQEIG